MNNDNKDSYQSIREHLELLGYKVDNDNSQGASIIKRFRAKSSDLNFRVAYFPQHGFIFSALYKIKPHAKSKQQTLLEIVNKMSGDSLLIKFFINRNFDILVASACYLDFYQKNTFGHFLNYFEKDVQEQFNGNPNVFDFID
jgi:hypothetical protein